MITYLDKPRKGKMGKKTLFLEKQDRKGKFSVIAEIRNPSQEGLDALIEFAKKFAENNEFKSLEIWSITLAESKAGYKPYWRLDGKS